MSSTIDAGGRVVIPKPIRDALGLQPGTRVELRVRDGMVFVVPECVPMRLVERGGTWVAEPDGGSLPALTADAVRDALEDSRR